MMQQRRQLAIIEIRSVAAEVTDQSVLPKPDLHAIEKPVHRGRRRHFSLRRFRSAWLPWRPAWRRALDDAGGYAPIAKTFDSDLSLVARHLADSRTAGHTAMDLEAQGLRRCLRIGRKSDIDKIGHLDFP